ncbi:hypothetical protein POL68_04700 [Stigmatella sp. ncwal1]|uniref:Bacterial spore germination immunoglobulin-like domain-containing protein n=1 Tax=Stigmatella ashevillensis TaxID=2995309 RepID=A0ABT5D681_9BACT|nr:hypothetical protein [Stigmatella ashevillena]MDC0707761.1 hypothetical protein [Stigmatella ashevillena]
MGLTRKSLYSCLAVREYAPLMVSALLSALLSAVLAGCGEEKLESIPSPPPSSEFTQIEFQAQLPQSPFASEITLVHVQIVGPLEVGTTVPLSRQGDTWKGSVLVPTTPEGYYFVGRALNASIQFLFESTASAPAAGPDGILNVVLPFQLRTPLPFTQLEFQAQLPQSELASEIAAVQVQIAGPSEARSFVSLSRQGDTWTWTGSVRVPPVEGGYSLVGRAFSADPLMFLFESTIHTPSAGPDGILNVVLPFQPRTP